MRICDWSSDVCSSDLGFLIEYFMRANDWFGAEVVILTSASSKTAMGLASVAKHNSPGIMRIGLTSAVNVDFVRATGLYDEGLAYGDVGALSQVPSVRSDERRVGSECVQRCSSRSWQSQYKENNNIYF